MRFYFFSLIQTYHQVERTIRYKRPCSMTKRYIVTCIPNETDENVFLPETRPPLPPKPTCIEPSVELCVLYVVCVWSYVKFRHAHQHHEHWRARNGSMFNRIHIADRPRDANVSAAQTMGGTMREFYFLLSCVPVDRRGEEVNLCSRGSVRFQSTSIDEIDYVWTQLYISYWD